MCKLKRNIVFVLFIVLSIVFVGCNDSLNKNSDIEKSAEKVLKKYNLYIDLDSQTSLLTGLYDVEVYLDGQRIGLIPMGKHFTSSMEVLEGSHEITFYKYGDQSIDTKQYFDVVEDCTIVCYLQTKRNDIVIKESRVVSGVSGNALSVDNVVGIKLSEAMILLKQTGFVNISYSSNDGSEIWNESNWTVLSQSVTSGAIIDKNDNIKLVCCKVAYDSKKVLDNESSGSVNGFENESNGLSDSKNDEQQKDLPSKDVVLVDEDSRKSEKSTDGEVVLTIDNCDDFRKVLENKVINEDLQKEFVDKYAGRIIEFDCIVVHIEKNSKYKTLYEYILLPGTEYENIGSSAFVLRDVGYYDFKLEKENKPSSVDLGSVLHMQAKVDGVENIYILLKPIKTKYIGKTELPSKNKNDSAVRELIIPQEQVNNYVEKTIVPNIKQAYNTAYKEYEYDSKTNTYIFYFAPLGVAANYVAATQSSQTALADVKTIEKSFNDLSALLSKQLNDGNNNNITVCVMVLNDVNNEKELFASVDGVKMFSALE